MKNNLLAIVVIALLFSSCKNTNETPSNNKTINQVFIAGSMKNVMWKGELNGVISLDTITNKEGLYGLGPIDYLKGELMINNGEIFASKVTSPTTMEVFKPKKVEAPFFVYSNVTKWKEISLPEQVKTIKTLETFLDTTIKSTDSPFFFKLLGSVNFADIHIQNLPEGSKVSSPKEAHVGQTNYVLNSKDVELVGVFSKHHKGIFTHHDSFLHIHLITKDGNQMGHLDAVDFNPTNVKLYLPQ